MTCLQGHSHVSPPEQKQGGGRKGQRGAHPRTRRREATRPQSVCPVAYRDGRLASYTLSPSLGGATLPGLLSQAATTRNTGAHAVCRQQRGEAACPARFCGSGGAAAGPPHGQPHCLSSFVGTPASFCSSSVRTCGPCSRHGLCCPVCVCVCQVPWKCLPIPDTAVWRGTQALLTPPASAARLCSGSLRRSQVAGLWA